MRMIFAAIFLVTLLGAGAGIEPANAGSVTFKLTNAAPYSIRVKFFSQDRRGWQWPSSTTHYTLDDGRRHEFPLRCRDGEKICYGGSYADNKSHWGVGFDGTRSCNGCCLTCGDNVQHAWRLNGGPRRANRQEGFGNDYVGVPID